MAQTINPFQKNAVKPTQVTVSLSGDQREIVEALGALLGIKTNTGVVMEGLAALYEKNKRQLAKTPGAEPSTESSEG